MAITDGREDRHDPAPDPGRDGYRTLVTGIRDYAIVMLDPQGRIGSWNEGARRILGYPEPEVLGRPASLIFTPEDVQAGVPEQELREAAETGSASDDRWHLRRDGSRVWVNGVTDALRDERTGELLGFAKVMRDATDQRRAAERLAAQYAVTLILADVPTLEQATPRILGEVCRRLGWEWGALWAEDRTGQWVYCVETCSPSTEAGARFAQVSRETRLPPGVGLPGRVWADGRPAWVVDVTRDPNFPRGPAAAAQGLHGAIAFPIRLGEQTLGVMEFISREVREPDDDLLRLMGTIGSQIGEAIRRRHAEDRLRESEARKGAVLQAALDCVISMDHEGRVVEWNPAAERTFGYSRDAAVGRALADLIVPPSLRERHWQGLARYLRTGEGPVIGRRVELPALRADGSEFAVELAITRIDLPGPPLFTAYLRDITERQHAEQSLRSSEERFREMVRNVEAVFWIGDVESRKALYISPVYERVWGRDSRELYANFLTWLDAIHPDDRDRVAAAFGRLAAGGRYDEEYRVVRPDGSVRWVHDRGFPVRDGAPGDAGPVRRIAGIAEDVTGRRHAADALREAKAAAERDRQAAEAARDAAETANRLKDEFLATLSHELRTPLNAILGWATILRRGGAADAEDVEQGLETIERNARAQAQLIDDLLDMSRIISGKLRLDVQPVDPAAFIDAAVETVRPAAEAKDIRLQKLLDPLAGPVAGDPNRLQQVVWNLLSNAIKFTPKGGRVRVMLGRVNSHVEVVVTDSGQGISPEFLPHVFERFRQADATSTRRHGGLGLGLSIVKHLVELHGGTVRADSPGEGHGSTFTVTLPLTVIHTRAGDERMAPRAHPTTPRGPAASSSAAAAAPDYELVPLGGLRVLAVDDEPDARELIRRLLGGCGAEVRTCASAAEALAALDAFAPDVLISDIGMPGTDGYDFLRQVRARTATVGGRTPAIALTAFARSEDRTRALRAGYIAHVAKPVEPAELIATVASVAGRT